MISHVGIVYDITDRKIRRIIVPDSDIELDRMLLGPGEIMSRMPKGTYDLHAGQDSIAQALALAG